MTDTPDGQSPPRERTALAETLIKWGTVAAGLIAAAQAGTTWINGYFSERNANIAAAQAVELQRVKDQSELAKTYLDLILSDQTTPQDRTLLYDALSQLKDHPLQAWAKQRYETNRLYVEALVKNAQERAEAARIKEESQRESTELKLEADAITLDMSKAQAEGDAAKVEELREKILAVYTKISETEAVVSVATITIEKSVSDQSVGSKLPELNNNMAGTGDTVVALSEKITPDLLKPLFGASASERIEDNYTCRRHCRSFASPIPGSLPPLSQILWGNLQISRNRRKMRPMQRRRTRARLHSGTPSRAMAQNTAGEAT